MTRPASWSHDRTHFYKYMTAATAKIVLQNRTLRWSSPLLFNDPFDVQFDLHVEYDRNKVTEETMEEILSVYFGEKQLIPGNMLGAMLVFLRDHAPGISRQDLRNNLTNAIEEGIKKAEAQLPKMHTEMRAVIADVKLLCLSEIFDNILMWSHYAKDHSGVVLRLSCIEIFDSAWGAAKPIKYEKNMPLLLNERETIELMSGQAPIDKENALHNAVFTKAIDWSYEKEWRLFGGRDSRVKFEDIKFYAEEFTGIYFGCRIDLKDQTEIAAIIKQYYPHAEMFAGKKSERSFSLEFEKLD